MRCGLWILKGDGGDSHRIDIETQQEENQGPTHRRDENMHKRWVVSTYIHSVSFHVLTTGIHVMVVMFET